MTIAPRAIVAEMLGTAILLAVVVGSGIMGATLSPENDAVALLGNTMATGAALFVLILMFGPLSGAHFNPAVTLAFLARGEMAPMAAAFHIAAQIVGAVAGVFLAHAMFSLDLVQTSARIRSTPGEALGEAVATFGLLMTIFAVSRNRPAAVPAAVALWIVAGYWFTSSTSFANPAVTLARALTDTFAGIRPADAPMFIAGQLVGAAAATGLSRWLFAKPEALYRAADAGTPSEIPDAR